MFLLVQCVSNLRDKFFRNSYSCVVIDVSPFVPRIKICYSCFRVGHISKACKSNPRCIFCGKDPHDKNKEDDLCPERNNLPNCINCQGGHLATSHDCPVVSKHKMVIALSATENIPFVEARRRIQQGISSVPADPRYDFVNYPPLNSRNSQHDSYKSITSNNLSNFTYSNNRFAILGSVNSSGVGSCAADDSNVSFKASNNSSPSNRCYVGGVSNTQKKKTATIQRGQFPSPVGQGLHQKRGHVGLRSPMLSERVIPQDIR